MRLKKLIIEKFRGFSSRRVINFNSLTALIGKNDAGKSTILEALEIFFEIHAIEKNDASVFFEDKIVTIGCVFDNLPEELIIDSTVSTTLQSEYLLNQQGELEIIKRYNCNNSKPTVSVYAVAFHPTHPDASNLLLLKQRELQTKVRLLTIDDSVDLTINKSMRQGIWNHYADSLRLDNVEIPLNTEDAKKIWDKLQLYLPIFSLFKSDRPSTDEDSEAQDPMKLAIAEALQAVNPQLEEIKRQVRINAMEVASRTIQKLNDFNAELANELIPKFKAEPKWDSLFKLSLVGSDQIPINKRGSGVRRLILLSFFRAEAERQLSSNNRTNVIYAIEEPETAQHPNFQRDILSTLLNLSENGGNQVIISTHVPGLAGLLPIDCIRYVYKNNHDVEVCNDPNAEVLQEIANNLGVTPTPKEDVKLLVCVEGIHDVTFLKAISKTIHQENEDIPDLDVYPNIQLVALGGDNLVSWVEYNYLERLGLPEYHIYDSDKDSIDCPCSNGHRAACETVNARNNGSSARVTLKRELENYIHPQAIFDSLGVSVTYGEFDNVPQLVSEAYSAANPYRPLNSKNIKKKLNNESVNCMTCDLLREIDPNGEIINWIREIADYCNSH